MDSLTPIERSKRMSLVKNKDSKAELIVRKLVHSMGYRYRLHVSNVPGKPDLVFPGKRKIIFVHGCFWHRHECFNGQRLPKSRLDFWQPKLEKNKERDIKTQAILKEQGWDVLIIWECMIKDRELLQNIIKTFLDTPKNRTKDKNINEIS